MREQEQDRFEEKFMMIENFLNELVDMRRQIAELKASEANYQKTIADLQDRAYRYKTIVENIPQRIFLKDKNSVYIFCNENYARDLKIRPDEIVGKTDHDFFPREIAEKYISEDRRIMGKSRAEEIDENYRLSGMELIVHMIRTPLRDEKGDILGILGLFWDITKQKRHEEEWKKYRGRLEEFLNKSLGELETIVGQLQHKISLYKRIEKEFQQSKEGCGPS